MGVGVGVGVGVGDALAEAPADLTAPLVVGVLVGVGVGVGVAVAAVVAVGASVGVGVTATTPTRNWPPASRWKWTDCRSVIDVLALARIFRASVRGADEQPARSATTARRPAANRASGFRRDT